MHLNPMFRHNTLQFKKKIAASSAAVDGEYFPFPVMQTILNQTEFF
jgi:hypothetical protein